MLQDYATFPFWHCHAHVIDLSEQATITTFFMFPWSNIPTSFLSCPIANVECVIRLCCLQLELCSSSNAQLDFHLIADRASSLSSMCSYSGRLKLLSECFWILSVHDDLSGPPLGCQNAPRWIARLVQQEKSTRYWTICYYLCFWNISTRHIGNFIIISSRFRLQSTKTCSIATGDCARHKSLISIIKWALSNNVPGSLSRSFLWFERIYVRYVAVKIQLQVGALLIKLPFFSVLILLCNVQLKCAISVNSCWKWSPKNSLCPCIPAACIHLRLQHEVPKTRRNLHFLRITISPCCLTERREIDAVREHFVMKCESQH